MVFAVLSFKNARKINKIVLNFSQAVNKEVYCFKIKTG